MSNAKSSKSTKRALGSILMAFEALVVFFATLVAFGTKALGPGNENAVIVWIVGLTIAILLIVTPAFLGKPGSYVWGWFLQISLVFLGIWVPLMYFIGGVFICLWCWAMIAGSIIDKARAVYLRNQMKGNQ